MKKRPVPQNLDTEYSQALIAVGRVSEHVHHLLPSGEQLFVTSHNEYDRLKKIEVLHAAEVAVRAGYTLAVEREEDTGYDWLWIRRGPEKDNGLKVRPLLVNDGIEHRQNLPKKNLGVLTLLKWASVLETPPDFDAPDLCLVDLDDPTAGPISPSEVMLQIEHEASCSGLSWVTYDRKTLTVGNRRLQYRSAPPRAPKPAQSSFLLRTATDWLRQRDHMVKEVTDVEAKVLDYSFPQPTQRFVIELTYTTVTQEIRLYRLGDMEDIYTLGLTLLNKLIDGSTQ